MIVQEYLSLLHLRHHHLLLNLKLKDYLELILQIEFTGHVLEDGKEEVIILMLLLLLWT